MVYIIGKNKVPELPQFIIDKINSSPKAKEILTERPLKTAFITLCLMCGTWEYIRDEKGPNEIKIGEIKPCRNCQLIIQTFGPLLQHIFMIIKFHCWIERTEHEQSYHSPNKEIKS